MIKHFFRNLFFILLFYPLVRIILGLNIKHKNRLPMAGPAILVANHNSHLDTIVLMSLFPLRHLSKLRPVAAAEYFLTNRYLGWFAKTILQIIPLKRNKARMTKVKVLTEIERHLENGSIIIYYPEGTRGKPEKMGSFKKGIAHLAKSHPKVPIFPIYIQGLGRVLPKGKRLLVPGNVNVVIGDAINSLDNQHNFIHHLEDQFNLLAKEHACQK